MSQLHDSCHKALLCCAAAETIVRVAYGYPDVRLSRRGVRRVAGMRRFWCGALRAVAGVPARAAGGRTAELIRRAVIR